MGGGDRRATPPGREERHPHLPPPGYRTGQRGALTGRAGPPLRRGARGLPPAAGALAVPAGLSLSGAVRRSGAAAALPGPGGAWPGLAPLRWRGAGRPGLVSSAGGECGAAGGAARGWLEGNLPGAAGGEAVRRGGGDGRRYGPGQGRARAEGRGPSSADASAFISAARRRRTKRIN